MASKKAAKPAPAPKSKSVVTAARKLVKKSAAVAKGAFTKPAPKPSPKAAAKPVKAAKPAAKPAKPAPKAVKPTAKAASKPVPKKASPTPPAAAKAKPKAALPPAKKVAKKVVVAPAPAAKPVAVKPAIEPPVKPAVKTEVAAAPSPPVATATPSEKPTKIAEPAVPAATGKIAKMMSVSKPSTTAASSTLPAKPAKTTVRRGAANGRVPSEEEIRSMPAADYMNDDQLAFFHERLLQMRSEVLAREVDVKERLHQREVFADPADRASAEEEHWLDLRLRERESLLLRKIEDAFRRIRDKEYGYCEKTGEAIGIARLLARPTATVCVDIKGQDERAESQYRDR
ncbi:MAG: dksA [Hydrocarboniphaga sp.]|uniref:TraR/DksA family transcriptional regulator n=1 Tax=Hydrocarboniphaga sp. TaxID=2033016 RepID=UPI0026305BC7|nr:TraR/DksA C4-type zinc finger protein [Hydrocarboniphaga sp.]MDB5968053.1 dksA [Hydrocarboniphaga sp.]